MLKSLEMFGFKSFAERTKFELSTGITCVVGPNGSGKSNVVDAIKWLLGDQSPKSLRGKEMTDVIFNGSKSCKPSGFAEAILTFDNSNDLLDIDAEEVQIGRRLYRSGDSEYIINGNIVRLKDIRDLLMGTGAGLSAYNIIEQGRVGQILQGNASSRRIIFEEAAGISKFKARKVDAGRKLDRVAQNLLRLTDIVDEVETQLNSTRNQASKAAKFREVSKDLRQWWLGLVADDYSRLTTRFADCEDRSKIVNEKWEECQTKHETYEKQRQQFDGQLETIDSSMRNVQQELATIREKRAERLATIRFQQDRSEELTDELERLQNQQQELANRVQSIQTELHTEQLQLEETRANVEADQTTLQMQESTLGKYESKLESIETQSVDCKNKIEELTEKLAERKNEVSRLNAQRETVHSAIERKKVELEEATQKTTEAQEILSELQTAYENALSHFSKGEAELTGLNNQIEQLKSTQEKLRKEQNDLREQRSAHQARLHVLQDLEQKQEGMAIGVREILQRANSSNQKPWNSVRGMVADLIEVDFEHAALLDVALGDRAQWVVVDALEPFLTYLDEELPRFAGRVGFWEWNPNAISFRTAAESRFDLSEHSGVMGRADRMAAGQDPGRIALLQQLLFDTWIVDSLDTAVELWRKQPGQARFVTLQGELIDITGSLIVGTSQGETSIVSRRSELRRLKSDLSNYDEHIKQNALASEQLTTQLVLQTNEWKDANEKLQTGSEQLVEMRSAVASQQQNFDRLTKDQTRHAEDLEKMVDHSTTLESSFKEQQSAMKTINEEFVTVQNLRQELSSSERELREQRAEALKQIADLQLELARDQQRLKNQTEAVTRLQHEQNQRQQQKQEASRRLTLSEERIQKTALLLMNLKAEADELLIRDEANSEEAESFSKNRQGLLAERDKTSSLETEFRQYRRELQDEQHRLEIDRRDIKHELTAMQEKIDDEYQMTLDEVAEQGVSAFQLYWDELHPAPEPSEDEETTEIEQTEAEVPEEDQLTFEDVRPEIENRVNRLRKKMKSLGNVNTESLDSLDELEQRHQHLNGQLQDLTEAKAALEQIVRKIDSEMKRLFVETYESIRTHFQELFRKMFGGGEGDVILEDPEDVLECGLEIVARPPGKELRSLGLLSGGEKTMTAVALLMAMFRSRPSPFCILDEVDAALDEANIDRYITVLKEFKSQTQFVMITHRKRSMTVADTLYGVTMEQAGISKRLVVQFDDVAEDGQINTEGKAAA